MGNLQQLSWSERIFIEPGRRNSTTIKELLAYQQSVKQFSNNFMAHRSFATKLDTFPRSAWRPNDGQPAPHTWGSLNDMSLFGSRLSKSQRPMMELVDVDLFSRKSKDPMLYTYDHPALAPQHFRRQGDNRFMLVFNWIIGEFHHVVL